MSALFWVQMEIGNARPGPVPVKIRRHRVPADIGQASVLEA